MPRVVQLGRFDVGSGCQHGPGAGDAVRFP